MAIHNGADVFRAACDVAIASSPPGVTRIGRSEAARPANLFALAARRFSGRHYALRRLSKFSFGYFLHAFPALCRGAATGRSQRIEKPCTHNPRIAPFTASTCRRQNTEPRIARRPHRTHAFNDVPART